MRTSGAWPRKSGRASKSYAVECASSEVDLGVGHIQPRGQAASKRTGSTFMPGGHHPTPPEQHRHEVRRGVGGRQFFTLGSTRFLDLDVVNRTILVKRVRTGSDARHRRLGGVGRRVQSRGVHRRARRRCTILLLAASHTDGAASPARADDSRQPAPMVNHQVSARVPRILHFSAVPRWTTVRRCRVHRFLDGRDTSLNETAVAPVASILGAPPKAPPVNGAAERRRSLDNGVPTERRAW